jgi:L-asparagine transporter-like permease
MTVQAGGPSGNIPTLASFGQDPWWLIIIKVLAIFLFLMLGTLFTIWASGASSGACSSGPAPTGPASSACSSR